MDAHTPEEFLARNGTTERFFPPPLTDEELEEMGRDEAEFDQEKPAQDAQVSDTPAKSTLWSSNDDTWDEAAIPRRQWIAEGYLMLGKLSLMMGTPAAR